MDYRVEKHFGDSLTLIIFDSSTLTGDRRRKLLTASKLASISSTSPCRPPVPRLSCRPTTREIDLDGNVVCQTCGQARASRPAADPKTLDPDPGNRPRNQNKTRVCDRE
ncbi:hypothetical protein N7499_009710 [Penicillium canescens]|uniref:uncharacterized protein n=1 Tax=Penicillium canescens TaxID=5083 RepID=UPI0026DF37B3|nr:uncharacterized protein N7446_008268 [Penicillium canescens]KAJ6019132.1 hypothetical protein N7522_001199 [Penicillium canescens]KAJ6058685.1 hypothetical protein N7446_008268 [Penicillium canescens]KAJ6071696.1 hypothetical protein N7499_009710 [Penicillium canescens]KAJ6170377.1 hypothetical protein N7485_007723 [Penicillium canescens]